MKKTDNKSLISRYWKAAAFLTLLAAWVSIPLVTNVVKADSTPVILVRTAVLAAPSGTANPHGIAEWQLYQSGNRELEVEVEDLNSVATGTVLTFFIDGANIGTAAVDSNRKAKLKLKTENGQAVPTVNNGSIAETRNGSTALVTGIFGGGTLTPTPTGSPTGTSSPTPSISPTGTSSPTPSGSPTGTSSPTPSVSPTGTASPSASPTPNGNNFFAGLSGPTLNGVLPGGYAEYEFHSNRVELESRVRQINLANGTALSFFVDGVFAGTASVDGGEARLRLRSDNGQVVPNVVNGSTIAVNNGAQTILTGTFSGIGATPTPTGTASPTPSGSPTGTASPTPSVSPTPSASPTPANGRSFEAHLTGSQVTPPVITSATGEIKVTLNGSETQATAFGEFHGLSSNQTAARMETTMGGGSLIRDLGIVGGINGNFANVTFNVTPAQVQQLRAGLWSAVITSVNNPNGEIHGTLTNHSSRSDFDGDGSHDLAIFRPATGAWYAENSSGTTVEVFGVAGDRVVSGDYDGDGKTDMAVYRDNNGSGTWYIKRSSDAGTGVANYGVGSDIPVRGDFDGDGRLDLAVFRPSTGVWYINKSNNTGETIMQFGAAGDRPMPTDMDGDGRDDIAVFRPSSGDWYWVRSSDSRVAIVHFGANGDIPAAGDYDGDGKSDPTVYRPSNGVWYTLRSTDGGFQATFFGVSGDVPVSGNYDGDGKTDIGVFRPSDGNWYILRSVDGKVQINHFGLNGDVPVIAQ